jgi:general secretion pathway protein G
MGIVEDNAARNRKKTKASEKLRDRKGEAGFTLVELLVVMVILVLLASLVAPRVMGYLGGSRSKAAKVQIENLATTLELFKLDTGRYPTASEGLAALVQAPPGVRNWNGPYLKKSQVPLDPWSQAYHYRQPGQKAEFDIYSLGADNRAGGTGENQDVTSWE